MADELGVRYDVLTGKPLAAEAGSALEPIPGVPSFWFSWHDFEPATAVYGLEGVAPAPAPPGGGIGFLLRPSTLLLGILALWAASKLVGVARDAWEAARAGSPWRGPWRSTRAGLFWGPLGIVGGALLGLDASAATVPAFEFAQLALAQFFVGLGVALAVLGAWLPAAQFRATALAPAEAAARLAAALGPPEPSQRLGPWRAPVTFHLEQARVTVLPERFGRIATVLFRAPGPNATPELALRLDASLRGGARAPTGT